MLFSSSLQQILHVAPELSRLLTRGSRLVDSMSKFTNKKNYRLHDLYTGQVMARVHGTCLSFIWQHSVPQTTQRHGRSLTSSCNTWALKGSARQWVVPQRLCSFSSSYSPWHRHSYRSARAQLLQLNITYYLVRLQISPPTDLGVLVDGLNAKE